MTNQVHRCRILSHLINRQNSINYQIRLGIRILWENETGTVAKCYPVGKDQSLKVLCLAGC